MFDGLIVRKGVSSRGGGEGGFRQVIDGGEQGEGAMTDPIENRPGACLSHMLYIYPCMHTYIPIYIQYLRV